MSDLASESLSKLEQAMHPGSPVNPEEFEVLTPKNPHIPKMRIEPKLDEYTPVVKTRAEKRTEKLIESNEIAFRELLRFMDVVKEHFTDDMSLTIGDTTVTVKLFH